MSARVFTSSDWIAARRRLAARANGPRRTIRRGIYLQETRDGRWAATILTWCRGKWQPREVIAEPTTYLKARASAMAVWRVTRLPLFFQRVGAPGVVGFRPGINEPKIGDAA